MKYINLIFLLTLSGCSTYPKAIAPAEPPENCADRKVIYVLNHGWHTGLVISAPDLNKEIPALTDRFSAKVYYEIGWGDSGFYQSNEITTGLAFRAMFASPGTVMHIVGFNNSPEEHFPESDVYRIRLNQTSYVNLIKYVKSSFAIGSDGNIVSLKHGLYGDSQFYSGVGTYHLFNTCNKWTAKALSSAGFDINPGIKLTASSIMSYLNTQASTSTQANTPKVCAAIFY